MPTLVLRNELCTCDVPFPDDGEKVKHRTERPSKAIAAEERNLSTKCLHIW